MAGYRNSSPSNEPKLWLDGPQKGGSRDHDLSLKETSKELALIVYEMYLSETDKVLDSAEEGESRCTR